MQNKESSLKRIAKLFEDNPSFFGDYPVGTPMFEIVADKLQSLTEAHLTQRAPDVCHECGTPYLRVAAFCWKCGTRR